MLTITAQGTPNELRAELRELLGEPGAAGIDRAHMDETNELMATIKELQFENKDLGKSLAAAMERIGLLEGLEAELEGAMKEVKRLHDLLGTPTDQGGKKKAAGKKAASPPPPPPPPAGVVTPESAATTPDGKWANELDPAKNERRPTPAEQGVTKDRALTAGGTFHAGEPVTLAWANGERAEGVVLGGPNEHGRYTVSYTLPSGGSGETEMPAAQLAPRKVAAENPLPLVRGPHTCTNCSSKFQTNFARCPDCDSFDTVVADTPAPRTFPAFFVTLPEPDLRDGSPVVVLVESDTAPNGWATPGGVIRRQFEGTSRYEVELDRGGYTVVDEDRLRAPRDGEGLVPEGREAFDPAKHQLPTFVEDAPTGDGQPDRLVTVDERRELAQLAKELQVDPKRMGAIIAREFPPKTSSAELALSELEKLKALLPKEAEVVF